MTFLWNSSIGRKLIMSITGLFLVLFLLFHMFMNMVAMFSREGYNMICDFLGANWYALAGTAVLAASVAVHFIYALVLTLQNRKARGNQRYASGNKTKTDWASKNMFVIGLIICLGLLIHLIHFWSKMQLVEILGGHENGYGFAPNDGAALIAITFSNLLNCLIYLVWFAALWFHLTHGFWSAFQTIGWSNQIWLHRIKILSKIVATVIFLGFASVVVYFYAISLCGGSC